MESWKIRDGVLTACDAYEAELLVVYFLGVFEYIWRDCGHRIQCFTISGAQLKHN